MVSPKIDAHAIPGDIRIEREILPLKVEIDVEHR